MPPFSFIASAILSLLMWPFNADLEVDRNKLFIDTESCQDWRQCMAQLSGVEITVCVVLSFLCVTQFVTFLFVWKYCQRTPPIFSNGLVPSAWVPSDLESEALSHEKDSVFHSPSRSA
ncbi:hypothetical protein Moror_9946 [Moniliophthora roreri MCA 2997]|uniref:Uncharacterized protein n=1 Tax=Moniliophthora roreri (strain MCA 2997) TaxID=1381753 RepID=V2WFQ4_MONRO|nr:hypothetical protein Moror_9946 [Moniliophthora roreri MCA 2997]